MSLLIGVDTGGTFTDVVVDGEGRVSFDKAFSTPRHPEEGVLAALENVGASLGLSVEDLLSRARRFAYGTTVATNALIQRRGARVGLLITKGFEDTTVIARGPVGRTGGLPYLQAMDFIHTEPPAPLVPRTLIRGVTERVAADGRVLVPLDRNEAAEAVRELVAAGVESLAVCFLWSFRNEAHERAVHDIAREVAPGLPVSLSCEIAPLLGEFERAMTTVVNAYVGPVTERHIFSLDRKLEARGLRYPIQVMKSSGGLTLAERVGHQAVAIVNSGPVGGLVAARYLGELLGYAHILTTDMGGTSFDVGLISRGQYEQEKQPFLDQGIPVQVPSVKVVTIGAGGGSVAWTDGRRLQVGPQSAGAEPGPAAYGLGGEEPTVTDALVILGILDPDYFFGGRRRLRRELAEEAIRRRVAEPLGLDIYEAASGIYEIVTAKMSDLIRKVSIETGHDPRDFVVFSYGGAGPAHAALFTRALGAREVIIPHAAPVFSAFGIALSDVLFTYARSEPVALDGEAGTAEVFRAIFRQLEEQARADLDAAGVDPAGALLVRKLDLRYAGQMNELTLLWDGELGPAWAERLRARFEELYQAKFGLGTTRAGAPLEVISFRLEALHLTKKPHLVAEEEVRGGPPPAPKGRRRLFLREAGWVEAAVYAFDAIRPGQGVRGPAVIERQDTTVLVLPELEAVVDGYRNIRICLGGAR